MRLFLTTAILVTAAAAIPAQNQCLHLVTGQSGYCDVPYDPTLVPPTGLTVEAWITFDDSTIPTGGLYYWPTIARQNVSPNSESWVFRVGSANTGNRNLEFKVRQNGASLPTLVYAFAPGEFAQWTHVAGTFDGTTMTIYKNGQQVATQTVTSYGVPNNGGVLRIGDGDLSNPGNETWNGDIDELRVWPFPRTAGEIAESMNQELSGMPGKVLTFNFNGNYVDSSHGLVGAPVGTIAFSSNTPTLTPMSPVSLNVGSSTTTCLNTIDTHLGSLPTVGNLNFAVWCTQGPAPASSSLGIAVGATAAAPAGQPPLLGVNLIFDLSHVLMVQAYVPGTIGLGNQRFALPIPNVASLVGLGVVTQFGFADSICGPSGFTGSDGIIFSVQ
jgi:Concanavalin A-like lectin/glucanases superfamily